MTKLICKKKDCNTSQKYIKGGKRGFCSKHGGYPICKNKGCDAQKHKCFRLLPQTPKPP